MYIFIYNISLDILFKLDAAYLPPVAAGMDFFPGGNGSK